MPTAMNAPAAATTALVLRNRAGVRVVWIVVMSAFFLLMGLGWDPWDWIVCELDAGTVLVGGYGALAAR